MKAKIRGTEIYFDIAGMQLRFSGNELVEKPVVFLLHGGPGGDHLTFKQHTAELQDVAQLVFIDHRGCGRSKKTKQKEYTLENNIEDVEALRKYLGLERINILGTSYGGMVAQGYAIRYPKNIDKLILVATSPSFRFLDDAKKNLQKTGTKKQIAICKSLWEGKFKGHGHLKHYFKVMGPLYSTSAKSKNKSLYKKLYGKSHTVWSPEAINEGFGGFMRTFDFIPKLKRVKSPTLILAGDKDWICSLAQAKMLAKNIKNAKLKIFKNSGHLIALDAHKQYIAAIKQFLTKKPKKSKRKKS